MDETISSVFLALKGIVQLISLFVQWQIRRTTETWSINAKLTEVNENIAIDSTEWHVALRLQKGKDLTAFLRTFPFIYLS